MRDLHEKHLMNGDFLLVNGDVIGNIPLEQALIEHRARRERNRNAIMTMILREVGESNRVRKSADAPLFVIDPTKDRCLHYEELPYHSHDGYDLPSNLEIDPELLDAHAEIDVRNDLYDCRIDICTPEVLGLWADSFDYQSPRTHFLHGVLKDYELNGMTIHTHILKDHYATRVQNLHAYDLVSRDVISRWTFPLCPDTNLFPGYTYTFKRNFVYQEQGVVLARSAAIHSRTVVGKDTTIGDGAVVTNSVIGRRCKIGNNVVLDGAYIWDDVVVGEATEIRHAIVANGSVIGDKCRIEPGALLSYNVKISSGISIPEGKSITTFQRDLDRKVQNDAKLVGKNGEGFEFVYEEDEDEEEIDFIPGLSEFTLLEDTQSVVYLTNPALQCTIWLSFRCPMRRYRLSRQIRPRTAISASVQGQTVLAQRHLTTRDGTSSITTPFLASSTDSKKVLALRWCSSSSLVYA